MVIWKFVLEIVDKQEVMMPAGAELLSVANQNSSLCLWALVNPLKEYQKRHIEVIGTGNRIPQQEPGVNRRFLGTAVIDPFVWHVFEEYV